MAEITLSTSDHFLLLIMGIILPLFAIFQSQPQLRDMTFNTTEKLQIYYGNSIFQWIGTGIVFALWWINHRSYYLLGLGEPTMTGLVWLLIGLFIVLYCLDVWAEIKTPSKLAVTKEKWQKNIPFLPVNWYELKHFFFVAFTAGVCEEIIFRGFFVQYFLAWNADNLMGTWLSIIIPAFLFSFGHIYQGHQAVFKTMLMAILFGWIFVLTNSLWVPILIHILVDMVGGCLALRILGTPKQ